MPKNSPDPDWMEVIKRRVRRLLQKGAPQLGLGDWDISLKWVPGGDGIDGDGFRTLFRVDPKWEYQSAMIDVHCSSIRDMETDELEYHLVHELMHCVVNEISNKATAKHEERVVCTLARSVLAVHRNSLRAGIRTGTRLAGAKKRKR
jgi:hypothetical protein